MADENINNAEQSLVNSAIGSVIRLDKYENLLAEYKLGGDWSNALKILDCEFDYFSGLMMELNTDGTVSPKPEFKVCEDLKISAHTQYEKGFLSDKYGKKYFVPNKNFLDSFRSYEIYLKLISKRHNIGYILEANQNGINPLMRPAVLQKNIRGRW